MRALLRRLAFWRRKPRDDRWWEDGYPVVITPFTGQFRVFLAREYCAAEWDITLHLHRQFFGDADEPRELQGLESFQ
jgi:hypothetical protein